MSTDSTELTFIRCPSCRSLVPAVSPRCRMCGATLDAAQKGEDKSADSRKASRVRQQTVSVSEDEVRAAKDTYGKKPVPVAEPIVEERNSANSESMANDPLGADPLGAFIEEVVEEKSNSNGHAEHVHEEEIPPAIEVGPESDDTFDPLADFTAEEATPPPAAPPVSDPTPQAESRPRVVIESGARRPGQQRSGLSFGRKSSGEGAQAAARPDQRSEAPRAEPMRAEQPKQERSEQSVQAKTEQAAPRPAPQRQEPPRVEPQVQQQVERDRSMERAEPIAQKVEEPRSNGVAPKKVAVAEGVRGKIFGWLISYQDPRGLATELRDGKFFISRASLKGTDLILDDESISTPHALMGVNVNDGLVIQDLMSDRGVFVRRKTGEAYQRVLETTKLEHGDWVRFGDVEFLVAIIAAQK